MKLACPTGPEFRGLVNLFGDLEAYHIWLANNQEVPETVKQALEIRAVLNKHKTYTDINKYNVAMAIYENSHNGNFYAFNAKDRDRLKEKLPEYFNEVLVAKGSGQNKGRYTISIRRPALIEEQFATYGPKRKTIDWKYPKKLKDATEPVTKGSGEVTSSPSVLSKNKKNEERALRELGIIFQGEEKTSVNTALQAIIDSKHALAPLAKKILEHTKNNDSGVILNTNGILIKKEYYPHLNIEDNARANGMYHHPSQLIEISIEANKAVTTLLHEAIHKASLAVIHSNSKAGKELNDIYEYAKANSKFSKLYAFSDTDEFIAGLFTNADFILHLQQIPARPNRSEYKNLWEDVMNYLLGVLNITQNSSIYEEAFAVATHVIAERAAQIENLASDAYISTEELYVDYQPLFSPSLAEDNNIKPGVEELFDSNPELANAVYEALGFEIPTTKLEGRKAVEGKLVNFDVIEELASAERNDIPSSILIKKLLNGGYLPKINETDIVLGGLEYGIWRPNLKKIEAQGGNKSTLAKKVGHELLHSVTHNIIYSYQNLKGVVDFNDKYNKDNIRQGYIKPVDLTKSQIEALDNLVRIRNKVVAYVEQNKDKIQKQDRGFGTYDYFIRTNYTESETDLHEFISEVFTNPELINILKEIPTEGKKSNLFKDFVDAIAKILGFTNTSILEDVIAYSEEAFFSQPQITPQQKQQSLQLYSQYLNTIFPDSKVKDIVYHGTNAEFDKFDKSFIKKDGVNSFGEKFYFLPKNMLHMIFKEQRILPVILNMPTYTDYFEQGSYETNDNVRRFEKGVLEELAVIEPEQIHILGSKQDIEGFKEFVDNSIKKTELFYQLGSSAGVEINTIKSILSKLNGFDTYFRTSLSNNTAVTENENELLKNILINKYNLTEDEYNYLLQLENKSETKQNFISRLLTAEYSKYSTNDIVINRLKELKNREFDSKLEEKLLDFSKKLGITTEILDNLKETFGKDAVGIADILNKIIYLNKNRKLDTLAEEVAHFYVELIGSKEGLGKNLIDKITSWHGYNEVYENYSKEYLGADGKPNDLKIKKEALGQAIAEAIVKKYTAESEFSTPEEKSFWKSILDFVNSISKLIRSSAYFPLDKLTNDIADKILSGNISDITNRIKEVSEKNKELKTYDSTLESLPAVKELLDYFSEIGAKLTGSLAIRRVGSLYRNKSEKVHDLDFSVTYNYYNGNTEEFVNKIQTKYPNYKPLNDKPYNGNNGELILNGIITESDELYNKFKNLTGDFNTRLDQFTLEEQANMLLIDLFFYPEGATIKLEEDVVAPDTIFNAKSNMGMRPKDAFDLLNYVAYKPTKALSEYSYYQLNKSKDLNILDARKDASTFSYTAKQEQALTEIASFVDTNNPFKYLLAGYAGTGKTTIIENIVNYLSTQGKTHAVSAPTNNAVKIIKSKLAGKTLEPVKTSTIHKLMYAFDPQSNTFTKKPISQIPDYIILDESSLINSDILEDIEYLRSLGKSIIFIGDGYQLEPVGKDPKLFTDKIQQGYFDGYIQLDEVKRQASNSAVLTVATVIRKSNRATVPSDSTEDFKNLNTPSEFQQEIATSIRQGENIAIVAATNKNRIFYNSFVRTIKNNGTPTEVLNDGETIVAVSNSNVKVNSEVFIINNPEAISDEIDIEYIDEYNNKKVKLTVQLFSGIDSEGDTITTLFSKNFPEASAMIFTLVDKSSKLESTLEGLNLIAYSDRGKRIISPKLFVSTYGYSITAHKSQGGQWDKVFIDHAYNADSWNAGRWLYTAVTRASKSVVVLNSNYHIKSKENTLAKFEEIAYTDNTLNVPAAVKAEEYIDVPEYDYVPSAEEMKILNQQNIESDGNLDMSGIISPEEVPTAEEIAAFNESQGIFEVPENNYNQIAPGTPEDLAGLSMGIDPNDIPESFEAANIIPPVEPAMAAPAVKGIEINSYQKGLGNALTNVHYAKNKKSEFDITPTDSTLTITTEAESKWGKSVEAWYKSNNAKTKGIPEGVEGDTYDMNLMVSLITDKLNQYPELIQQINANGGLEFLQKSTHNMGNGRWSSKNPKNMFINALVQAYKNINSTESVQPVAQKQTDANAMLTFANDQFMDIIEAGDNIIPGFENRSSHQVSVVKNLSLQLIAQYNALGNKMPTKESFVKLMLEKIFPGNDAISEALNNVKNPKTGKSPLDTTWTLVSNMMQKYKEVASEVDKESLLDITEEDADLSIEISDKDKDDISRFADNASLKENHTLKLGKEVKKLLFLVPVLEQTPEGKFILSKNDIGLPEFMSLEDVTTELQGWLSGYDNDYNVLKKAMSDLVQFKPWIKFVINKLNDEVGKDGKIVTDRSQERTQFTRWATKHYVDLKIALWEPENKKKFTNTRLISADQNNIKRYVINQFNEKFRRDTGIVKIEGLTETIDVNKLKDIQNQFKAFIADVTALEGTEIALEDVLPYAEKLTELFTSIGLDAHVDIFTKFASATNNEQVQTYTSQGPRPFTFKQHIVDSNGIVIKIADGISKIINSIEDGSFKLASGSNPLWDNNGVRNYVEFYTLFIDTVFTNSMRNGNNDTIWGYTNNKSLSNRVRDFKKNSELAEKLISEVAFHNKSLYLNRLADDKDEFKTYLELFYVDAIRKQSKTGTTKAKPIDRMSPRELSLYKMIAFFNQGNNWSTRSGRNRLGYMFNMTMSDKATLMGVRTLLHNTSGEAIVETNNKGITNIVDFKADVIEANALKTIIAAEIMRINTFNQLLDSKAHVIDIKGYNKGGNLFLIFPFLNNDESINSQQDGKAVEAFKKLIYKDGVLVQWPDIEQAIKTGEGREIYSAFIKEFVDLMVKQQLDTWAEQGIYDAKTGKLEFVDSKYKENIIKPLFVKYKPTENIISKAIAMDYVVNYLLHYTNTMHMFSGDPAMYFKPTKANTILSNIESTLTNIGKRLASENAPGYEGSTEIYALQPKANVACVKDLEVSTMAKAYIDRLIKSKEYGEVTATDAQELNTLQEFAFRLLSQGYINKAEYQEVLDNYYNLSDKLINKLLGQPIKPVHRGSIIDTDLKAERIVYIKTSAYPLIPQFVKNTPLDKLRKQMEEDPDGSRKPFDKQIHRLVFDSGIKVGGKVDAKGKYLQIWDGDYGNIYDNLDFTPYTLVLDRVYDRIQQEVPFKADKKEVNRSTQVDQNLFVDQLEVTGYAIPKWAGNGTGTGAEIKEIYDANQEEIYKLAYDEFMDEILSKDPAHKGELDRDKLKKVIEREAASRNYSPTLSEYLTVTNNRFDFKLALIPEADKIESLLLSLIDNKVRKKKMPGFSGVLASESGYNGFSKDITYTNNDTYNPSLGLKPQRVVFTVDGKIVDVEDTGYGELMDDYKANKLDKKIKAEVRGSQILVPWKFRDGSGKMLNINDFMVEKDGIKTIDTSKLSKDVLDMFGFRIPNQGPNSKAIVEVVGFTPYYMGDLIIASKDFTKQMGSDFDVDKLYVYMYATVMHNGVLTRLSDDIPQSEVAKQLTAFEYKNKILQNKNLDLHLAMMSNPNLITQAAITQPLGFMNLKELADEISASRFNINTSLLISDTYQSNKYLSARGGKLGTGIWSVASTGNAQLQGKNFDIYVIDKALRTSITQVISDLSPSLSYAYTHDGVSKHEILTAFQAAALDEEKEQILSRLNINKVTMPIMWGMLQQGYNINEIIYFINQPAIVNYVKIFDNLTDSTTKYGLAEGSELAKEKVFNEELDKLEAFYKTLNLSEEEINDKIEAIFVKVEDDYGYQIPLSLDTLKLIATNQADKVSLEDYVYYQLSVLQRMGDVKTLGDRLASVFSSINTYTKGLGLNLFTVSSRADKIEDYSKSQTLVGYSSLVGKNITGLAIKYALETANNYYNKTGNDLFKYDNLVFNSIYNSLKTFDYLGDSKDIGIDYDAKLKKELWNNFKSYLYSQFTHKFNAYKDQKLNNPASKFDIVAERKRLFLNNDNNTTLAQRVFLAQQLDWGKANQFLNKLEIKRDVDNPNYEYVTFDAGKGVADDESNIYQGFTDLFNNARSFALGMDLVIASFASGGIQEAMQYVRYIPPSVVKSSQFLSALSSVNLDNGNHYGINAEVAEDGITEEYYPPFVYQFLQHDNGNIPVINAEIAKTVINPNTIKGDNDNNILEFMLKDDHLALYSRILEKNEMTIVSMMPVIKLNTTKQYSPKFYMYDYKSNKYKLIHELGQTGMLEYNRKSFIGESIFATFHNQFNKDIKENTEPLDSPLLYDDMLNTANMTIPYSTESTEKLLTAHTGNEYVDLLANRIVNMGISEEVKVIAKLDSRDTASTYQIIDGVPTVKFHYDYNNLLGSKVNLLHEYMHAIIHPIIAKYAIDPKMLTPNQRSAIKNLYTIKQQAINNLKTGNFKGNYSYAELLEFEAMYNEFKLAKKENRNPNVNYARFNRLRDKYYGLLTINTKLEANGADVDEFINAFIADKGFMELLNSMPSDNKTLFDKVIENMVMMLKSAFGNVMPNSLLEESLKNIMLLTEVAKVETPMEKMNNLYSLISNLPNNTYKDPLSLLAEYQTLSRGINYHIDSYVQSIKCKFKL